MIPIARLKKDVQFNTELTKIVDVLKGISAARFHVLERQLALFEPYFKAAEEILATLDVTQVAHPFVQPSRQTVGVVMVTSDAGFLGGLNTQVVNTGLRQGGSDRLLTVIGERGANYLHDLRQDCTAFPGIEDASRLSLALAVREHVARQVLEGQCGRMVVVYPKPLSFAVQEVTVETLLPCSAWIPKPEDRPPEADVLWESLPSDVVEYVVIQWIGHRLDEMFAMSRLAELAARVIHLEGSYQELTQRGKKLRLQYFRARHEIIDRSMREIFSAKILCGSGDGG